MNITSYKTRIFKRDEILLPFIDYYLEKPKNKNIIVVTSKIVALSEGRLIEVVNKNTREQTIIQESDFAMRTKRTWLTIKDGTVMMSAGVDESNADGKIILLPKDSYRTAQLIQSYFIRKYKLKQLGVIITDSRCLPLRAGIAGVALGYAGFRGLKKYAGQKDLFGRTLKVSRVDVADSLATAAVYTMGEGNEQRPLALITDVDVVWAKRVNKHELWIDPREDVYQPIFENIYKIKIKK